MRARSLLAALLLLAVAGSAAAARAGRTSPDLHEPFDRLLAEHVRAERIDYLLLRRPENRTILRDHLDALAEVDLESMTRDERLAYDINLYNATMIDVVLERFRAGYSVSADDFAVFDEPLVRRAGHDEPISLNHLEHEIIRPEYDEPRIHAALVCAARSCPPILPRAYRADDLDAVLEANMRRWLNDPGRNRIDREKRTLVLSQIFDWYGEDFGGTGRLPGYVNPLVAPDVAGWSVEFMSYSWDLNLAAPAEGRWMEVRHRRRGARLEDGTRLEPREIVEVLETDGGRHRIRVPRTERTGWIRSRALEAWTAP